MFCSPRKENLQQTLSQRYQPRASFKGQSSTTRALMPLSQHLDHYNSVLSLPAPSQSYSALHLLPPSNPFYSPMVTIATSLQTPQQTSLYDIIESYAVISMRIRELGREPSDATKCFVRELQPVAPKLYASLERDLRCIFEEKPSLAVLWALQPDYGRQEKRTDIATLVEAIKLISIIFHDQDYHALLTHEQLNILINHLMTIVRRRDQLPSQKDSIPALVMSIFSHQTLPKDLLVKNENDFVWLIQTMLMSGAGGPQGKAHAFKAIRSIAKKGVSLAALAERFMKTILSSLSSNDPEIRKHAAFALTAFVTGKFRSDQVSETRKLATSVTSFIVATEKNGSISHVTLSETIRTTMTSNPQSDDGQGSIWTFLVVISLLYLCDNKTFDSPYITDFFFTAMGRLRKLQDDRTWAPLYIWGHSAMLWTFSRLVSNFMAQKKRADFSAANAQKNITKALENVMPTNGGIGRPDLGLLFVACFLSIKGHPMVHKATDVLRTMLETGDAKSVAITGEMLSAMLRPASNSKTAGASTAFLFCRDVFIDEKGPKADVIGTLFYSKDRNNVMDCVRDHVVPVGMEHICKLKERDVERHWERLMKTWKSAAERSLEVMGEVTTPLWDAFQGLLLLKSQLTQGKSDLEPAEDHGKNITSFFIGYMQEIESAPEVQCKRLPVLLGLWQTIANSFSGPWLMGFTDKVLSHLETAYSGDHCASLDALYDLFAAILCHASSDKWDKRADNPALRKPIWTALCRGCISSSISLEFTRLCHLVIQPLSSDAWSMSGQELDIWSGVLSMLIQEAETNRSLSATAVLDDLIEQAETLTPQQLAACLECMNGRASSLPMSLLALTVRCLETSYPSKKDDAMYLLCKLRPQFPRSASHVLEFFSILEDGLLVWIGDSQTAVPIEDYSDNIVPLYHDILASFEHLESSPSNLEAITPLLVSIFEPENVDPEGTSAFLTFWSKTYHNRPDLISYQSDTLKACLCAYSAVFGGNLGDGLEFADESQESQDVLSDPRISPVQSVGHSPVSLSSDWGKMIPSLHRRLSLIKRRIDASRSLDEVHKTKQRSFIDDTLITPPRPINSPNVRQHGSKSGSLKRLVGQGSPVTPVKRRKLNHDQDVSTPLPEDDQAVHASSPSVLHSAFELASTKPGPSRPHRKLVFDGVELPRVKDIMLSERWQQGSTSSLPASNEGEEDYNSWEQPLNENDVQNLQETIIIPDSPAMQHNQHGPLSPLTPASSPPLVQHITAKALSPTASIRQSSRARKLPVVSKSTLHVGTSLSQPIRRRRSPPTTIKPMKRAHTDLNEIKRMIEDPLTETQEVWDAREDLEELLSYAGRVLRHRTAASKRKRKDVPS